MRFPFPLPRGEYSREDFDVILITRLLLWRVMRLHCYGLICGKWSHGHLSLHLHWTYNTCQCGDLLKWPPTIVTFPYLIHLTSVSASSGLWRASLVTSHDAVWCACATHSTSVIVAWRGSLGWRTSANQTLLIIAQTSRRYIATSCRFMLWAGEFYAIPCGLTSNWNRIYYYSRIYFVSRRHWNAIIGM